MKIAVIGANGRTGRMVVKDALARGHQVIAIARTHELSEPDDDNLTNARADVHDPDALTCALDRAKGRAITHGDLAAALLDSLTRQVLYRHAAYVAN